MKATKEEFLKILTAYQGILHKVSLVYFGDTAEREDNFQEIVYQLWKSFPVLKKRESIGSWIYAVSINTSLSRMKKTGRMKYLPSMPEMADKSDAYREMVRDEEVKRLIDAIHRLDEVDRSIMLLYLEEKSYAEISEILGMSVSNVGVRINRAKKTLKQLLNPESHE